MRINKVAYLSILLAVAIAAIWSAVSRDTLEARAQANVWRSSGPMSTESFPSLAIDPSDSNTVYAGIRQRGLMLAGVFKSVDGGASWNPTGMQSLSVEELAIDPTRPSTIYAAVASETAAGVYKSTDAGASWTPPGLPNYRFSASALAIDPKQPNTLYASASSFYKSTDGGLTWSRPNPTFIHTFHSLVLDPENPRVIYGATQNDGVFKSADGGVIWNPTAPISRNWSRPSLAIDPKNTSVLYAAYDDIYKTTNGGATWTIINNNVADPDASAVAIDPVNPNTVYIGTYASNVVMYKSTNGGASWSAFNAGLPHSPSRSVLSLVIDRTGTSLHVGLESGGVYDYLYEGLNCTLSCSATAPATGTVNAPIAFTASATATGCSGAPSYDWDFGDNTAHSSQQNPPHIYATAGVYNWRMTASVAGATSCVRTGTITINTACTQPSIITQPSSQTINSGQAATLSVAAQGTAPLNYQWYRGQSGDTSNPIPGATASSFTTPPLNATTSYWVRVSNACSASSRVDSATATITITAPLQLEIIDPACIEAGICPGRYLVDQAGAVGLTPDLDRLASASVKRDGAVADGVTLLLLRVLSDSQVRITLKKLDGTTADANWGTLRTRIGTASGNSVLVTPDTVGTRKIAFAIYQTPIDFPGREIETAAGLMIEASPVANNGNPSTVRQPISLLRTPVVLIHGVWSDGEAWEKLDNYLTQRGFNVCDGCRPDYGATEGGKYKASSFDPAEAKTPEKNFVIQQLITATNQGLNSVRVPHPSESLVGYAATQVDVVGHSMGGLVVRARASNRYRGLPYKRKNNYNQGDFHKLITVGTPHRGTPLADWLIERKCDILTIWRNISIEDRFNNGWTVANIMRTPIGPAIYGFQTSSDALKNIGGTTLKAHAIIGKAPGTPISDTENNLNRIPYYSGLPPQHESNRGLTIDCLLSGRIAAKDCPTNRYGEHDTIVPIESQRGGLSEKATSLVTNVVHTDIELDEKIFDDSKETASMEVWKRIEEALLASTTSEKFGAFTALNSSGNSRKYDEDRDRCSRPLSSLETVSKQIPAATVTITPSPGTVVQPGDLIQIELSVTGGNPVNGALFIVGNRFHSIDGVGPFSFSFRVPGNHAGRLDIGAGTFGQGPENYEASTYIVVTPDSPPLNLTAAPATLQFESFNEKFQLRVSGAFPGGNQINLTSSAAGTSYSLQSGANSIVAVSADGLVEARGTGRETILISNAGKTASVSVIVNLTNPAPSITNINPQTATAGEAAFSLTVSGANFTNESVVYWNGAPRSTAFVSSVQLTAAISAADIASTGNVTVTVFIPSPGGGVATTDFRIISVTATVTSVSAASFGGSQLASESIVAAFGPNLATSVQAASSIPLPTSLAGTTVRVKDSAGAERLAPLFFVSPLQVNYQIPPGVASGAATVTITGGDGAVSLGAAQIAAVAPGFFSANGSGQGVAAAVALRVRADGSQIYERIYQFDQAQGKFVSLPLDLGPPTDQLFLVLYGTGIRYRSSLSAVTSKLGGIDASVLYAGPADGYVGLDQVNLSVPRSLAGRGEIDIVITADGKTANTVQVNIGPVTTLTPTITSVSPNSVTASGPAFSLTVIGNNFVNGSIVRWNGNPRKTTFISRTQLTSEIPANDIATSGAAGITVFNPGEVSSNSLSVSILPGCAISIAPTSQSFGAVGGNGVINVTTSPGCIWSSSTNADWISIDSGRVGSSSGTVAYSVAINTSANNRVGVITVVGNTFTVTQEGGSGNPVPALTRTAPASVVAGGPAFTLTVNGTNFINTSVVRWNGSSRTTIYVNGSQLTAQITAADIASAGAAGVTVFNPLPGGGVSNTLNILINSGVRWQESGLQGETVTYFVVSGAYIFAATSARNSGESPCGIYRSTDGGKSWTRVFTGVGYQNVSGLAVKSGNVFAGIEAPNFYYGVYSSTDNGQNWARINGGLPNQHVKSLTGGTEVFAGTDRPLTNESGGVYKLLDGDKFWARVFRAPPNQGVTVLAGDGAAVFAGTNGFGTSGSVYRSIDGGQNWGGIFSGQRNHYVNALGMFGSTILVATSDFGTSNIAYRLTDNGQNWAQIGSGLTNRDVRAFAVSGANIFAGTRGGGVFRSTDNGQNWIPINDGLTNLRVISLLVIDTKLFAGVETGGIFVLDLTSLISLLPVWAHPIVSEQAVSDALTQVDQM